MAAAARPVVDVTRRRVLTTAVDPVAGRKCVLYWMSRDQRADDNWALLYAHQLAEEIGGGAVVKVVFNLVPRFLEATLRQYAFMTKGLAETEVALRKRNIPMLLLKGAPSETLPALVARERPAAVVTDMSPLRVPTAWAKGVAAALDALDPAVPLHQIDAHNIVPVWVASDKQEVGARTIRKKITDKLGRYLTEFPPMPSNPSGTVLPKAVDWDEALASVEIDRTVLEVAAIKPGADAAHATLKDFITTRLNVYADKRNDPVQDAQSGLSPYFHFGQLSAQRAALEVKRSGKHASGVAVFIEEAVVRRELSDNFCFYNANYDNIDGAAGWARESLQDHAADKREYVYTRAELEEARTHDPLWNAAQRQLVLEGKMHGFLRMYWAKKILEWTDGPETALADAIYLNDRYSLDGRDPNGFVGCMWSICGIHDMGWMERPVFGKIRFMNYNGCKRKFNVAAFEAKYKGGLKSTSAKKPPTAIDKFVSGSAASGGQARKHAASSDNGAAGSSESKSSKKAKKAS